METTFIVSGAAICFMIGFRMLELKFKRPIVLAHVSLPADRHLRKALKSFQRSVGEKVKSKVEYYIETSKQSLANSFEVTRIGALEYYESLREALRGKRSLSRGSVSFFLLNISDYHSSTKALPQPEIAPEFFGNQAQTSGEFLLAPQAVEAEN